MTQKQELAELKAEVAILKTSLETLAKKVEDHQIQEKILVDGTGMSFSSGGAPAGELSIDLDWFSKHTVEILDKEMGKHLESMTGIVTKATTETVAAPFAEVVARVNALEKMFLDQLGPNLDQALDRIAPQEAQEEEDTSP